MHRFVVIFTVIFLSNFTSPQDSKSQVFTTQDTLRGSITPERIWWDLISYDLYVSIYPEQKFIKGKNTVFFKALEEGYEIQIDLQAPLKITAAYTDEDQLKVISEGSAHYILLANDLQKGDFASVTIEYEGKPRIAPFAPWDGGFSWKTDDQGNHFIATSCQGLGASVWWPCKDHMYDEVDSMTIRAEVPMPYTDVSNGRLISIDTTESGDRRIFTWKVLSPINNYGVNLNIGKYISWTETYYGEDGDLDITYWALEQHEKEAKRQFKQVPLMLEAFEYWFGPYPFYKDGYQLVEAPYLGMEHQSSITYGNQFINGYLGTDLSGTGWGLKFDFIIIHESGHEWFANNITHKDQADMWIHESFTSYSEGLFVEYHYGKEAGQAYTRGTREKINNDKPMTGPYGVNFDNYSIDVYYKGANMLNTLRSIVNNDEKWRNMLRTMNKKFRHQTVTSSEIEAFISEYLGLELSSFFDQYLRQANIPTWEYYIENEQLFFRWTDCVEDFNMPLDIEDSEKYRIYPFTGWQRVPYEFEELPKIDENFYINIKKQQ